MERNPTMMRARNEIKFLKSSFQRSSHVTRYSRITHELRVGLADQIGGGEGLWSFLGGLYRRLISEPSVSRHSITYTTHRSVILLAIKPGDPGWRALSLHTAFIACSAHPDRIHSNHCFAPGITLEYMLCTISESSTISTYPHPGYQ
jgi:hypothetical protein